MAVHDPDAPSGMFDTKIAIVVREDLVTWQKLNVTVFLTSGIIGANEGLLGEPYRMPPATSTARSWSSP
jgi:hypothetical protein